MIMSSRGSTLLLLRCLGSSGRSTLVSALRTAAVTTKLRPASQSVQFPRCPPSGPAALSQLTRTFHSALLNQAHQPQQRASRLVGSTLPGLHQPVRTLFIQTESTPNPQSLKFIPGRSVLPETETSMTMNFPDFKTAQSQSPLAAKLFGVDGVNTVFFGADYITVNISEGHDWVDTKPAIFGVIMDYFATGDPVLVDGSFDLDSAGTKILDTDDEATALIKEILESRVRPAVQEDGGDITFKEFNQETGIVWLQLRGSCSGCPSSAGTLKFGIQNMLMHYVEEVKGVEEWVDEELESVSQDQLRKLEERLAEVRDKKSEE